MFISWALLLVILYVLGVYWCYEVVRRFRDDVKELREFKVALRSVVIIIIWALTIVIAIVLVRYTVVIISRLASFIRELV